MREQAIAWPVPSGARVPPGTRQGGPVGIVRPPPGSALVPGPWGASTRWRSAVHRQLRRLYHHRRGGAPPPTRSPARSGSCHGTRGHAQCTGVARRARQRACRPDDRHGTRPDAGGPHHVVRSYRSHRSHRSYRSYRSYRSHARCAGELARSRTAITPVSRRVVSDDDSTDATESFGTVSVTTGVPSSNSQLGHRYACPQCVNGCCAPSDVRFSRTDPGPGATPHNSVAPRAPPVFDVGAMQSGNAMVHV